ncbi:MAG: hypothetical protein FJZ59_01755 [Chlamydiae bacterium]|nr:hypothetical protein [Chlamydiota bacterium]
MVSNISTYPKANFSAFQAEKTSVFSDFSLYARVAFIPIFFMIDKLFQITALALSCFGFYNNSISRRLENLGDKIGMICVSHPLYNLRDKNKKNSVVMMRNLPLEETVWTEEEFQKVDLYLQRARTPNYFRDRGIPEFEGIDLDLIRNMCFLHRSKGGVCLGASLIMIKNLLNLDITNETDLIRELLNYKKGFSSNATAIQYLNHAYVFAKLEEMKREVITLQRQTIEQFACGLSSTEWSEKIRKEALKFSLSLCDLKCSSHFIEVGSIREDFQKLENGYYQIGIPTSHSQSHSVVYVKQPYGSYFIDPNLGLIKCYEGFQYTDLNNLLRTYNGDNYYQKKLKVEVAQLF